MNTIKLGTICDVVAGGTPSRSKPEYWQKGTIPWIKIGNIKGKYIKNADEFITNEGLKNSSAKMLSKGTILYTIFATLGEVGILDFDACTNQAIAGITIKEPSLISENYLYYYLRSKKNYINSIGRGVAQNNINLSILRNFDIPLPEIKKQKEIINTLDNIATIIALRKKQIQKLDELIKARFVELFGSVKEERLLGDISEFVTVGIANSATHAYAESGIPMLRNQNIKENRLDDSELIYIKPEFAAQYESKKLKENDIIAMRTGYPGIACLVPKKYEDCQTFTTLIVRLKAGNNPRYVCSYINSNLGRRFIDSSKVGVAQQNFGAKSFAKMPIKIAPKEMQNEYAEFVAQVEKSKFVIQKALDKTQLLFDSMMQQYFG